jgi:hypothetical protein
MILPTEAMCIVSSSILNQTNARASSYTLKFFIICQNGFWKKAIASGLTFVSYNIELSCGADSNVRLRFIRMNLNLTSFGSADCSNDLLERLPLFIFF